MTKRCKMLGATAGPNSFSKTLEAGITRAKAYTVACGSVNDFKQAAIAG